MEGWNKDEVLVNRSKIFVVDNYNITVYDIRHMSKPVIGPVMHMIDEGIPAWIEGITILSHKIEFNYRESNKNEKENLNDV